MSKQCEQCGNEFIPYSARNRFCTRECSDAWFAAERREAVKRLRAEAGATYFDRAQFDEDAPGGRFAKASPAVVGSGDPLPIPAARYAADPGLEPPLGECVDALPDMLIVSHGGSR